MTETSEAGLARLPAGSAQRIPDPAAGTVARPADVSRAEPWQYSITAEAKVLYRVLLLDGMMPDEGLCAKTRLSPEQVRQCLKELADLGLITFVGDAVTAVPYTQAVEFLLAAQGRFLEQALDTVRQAQRRLNVLIREGAELGGDGVGTVLSAPQGDDPDRVFRAAQDRPVATVTALHPGARFSEELLDASLRSAAAQLANGLTLRVIHQNAALSHPQCAEYFHKIEQLGGQVRFSEVLPFRLMLIDGKTAVCRLADPGGASEALLFQGTRMLRLLGELFETVWVQAAPLAKVSPQPGPVTLTSAPPSLGNQEMAILRYLADGATDQAIARHLGVTTRTVARRITEIYQVLGVHSRFQAGAVARRRGLI
jgi:DNA-binding CsgD family transcriptional regulator